MKPYIAIDPKRSRLRKLGTGMYGDVWLELDTALNVRRAVKYVDAKRFADASETFAEPRMLLALRHDHVVEVYEAGIEDGNAYTVMEFLALGSLDDQLSRGTPCLSLAKKWSIDICRAVEYTHSRGLIHRDIKPSNALLADNGTVKLSDFGLAAPVGADGRASAAGYGPHLAPETLTEHYSSELSDVYALALTTYRLVNGNRFLPNFRSFSDLQELIVKGRYPDRTRFMPYVPGQLRRVIVKGLQPDPMRRFQSARAFRHGLEAVPVQYDWVFERQGPDCVVWRTDSDDRSFEILITSRNKTYNITLFKRTLRQLKRVKADSLTAVSRTQASRHTERLLQRITVEGK
jgi:serine/threonine-protein kinase